MNQWSYKARNPPLTLSLQEHMGSNASVTRHRCMRRTYAYYLRLFASITRLRSRRQRDRRSRVKLDPGAAARIRKYVALSMVERYGKYGPP